MSLEYKTKPKRNNVKTKEYDMYRLETAKNLFFGLIKSNGIGGRCFKLSNLHFD